MIILKDTATALAFFVEAANKQTQAIESGDHKTANKNYNKIFQAVGFLKSINSGMDDLKDLLNSPLLGVRLWAAYFLLPTYEKQAIVVLKDIKKTNNIHSVTAEMTLKEWEKGNITY